MNTDTMGRFCRLEGSKFQTDGVAKLNEHSPEDFKLCFGIFKSLLLGLGLRLG